MLLRKKDPSSDARRGIGEFPHDVQQPRLARLLRGVIKVLDGRRDGRALHPLEAEDVVVAEHALDGRRRRDRRRPAPRAQQGRNVEDRDRAAPPRELVPEVVEVRGRRRGRRAHLRGREHHGALAVLRRVQNHGALQLRGRPQHARRGLEVRAAIKLILEEVGRRAVPGAGHGVHGPHGRRPLLVQIHQRVEGREGPAHEHVERPPARGLAQQF
mmetsp:Transcript_7348/g.21712  ORF Transcript_7348/g.21712 Transcript_7348/m.21712 type:complete len:214 (-) Transcript_7348:400-1041(-)